MRIFLRPSIRTFVLFAAATYTAHAADQAQPATMPMAIPAFVDVVTFDSHFEGENHKVVVTLSPNLLRVDEPDDGYSVIYDPLTQHYTGLENRNYTYWQFSWPEVRAAVENSKRYETHLQDLNNEGLNDDNPNPSTNSPPSTDSISTSGASAGDDSGYVWRPTMEKKRIAGLDCVRWTGDTVSGEPVEVWCYPGVMPKVEAAVAQLRAINEPMALVPVRTVVPDFIFPVYAALSKAGVNPVLITWGDDTDKNHFAWVETKTREGKLSLFTVPKLYMKTTLITMDGMIDSQPVPAPHHQDTNAPSSLFHQNGSR